MMVFSIELRELLLQDIKRHPALMDILFGTEHYQLTDMSKHGAIIRSTNTLKYVETQPQNIQGT